MNQRVKTILTVGFVVTSLSIPVFHLSSWESKPLPPDTFDYKITVFNGDGIIQSYSEKKTPILFSS